MAVYTDVSEGELEAFLRHYPVGSLLSYKGIAEGTENSNFLLHTTGGTYILTLYEKRVERADLPFFLGLMDHLAKKGISCPLPVHRQGGEMIGELAGRPAVIITFLEGMWLRRPRAAHCREVGRALAALHLAGADFTMTRPNALAIDGDGRPCRVRTSNAGHLLYVGLPAPERAQMVAEQLLSAPFQSGWGIRTLADDAIFFNPMSYHNGSIWPHDTAICTAGMARYGVRDSVVRLMSGTFEAAVHFNMRLPELFCGFTRAPGEAPIAYPVACLPQAWSAGAAFMLMQACLGLEIDGWKGEIKVTRPRLPIGIDNLVLRHLQVGDAVVDLNFQRVGDRVVAYLDDRHEGLAPLVVRT